MSKVRALIVGSLVVMVGAGCAKSESSPSAASAVENPGAQAPAQPAMPHNEAPATPVATAGPAPTPAPEGAPEKEYVSGDVTVTEVAGAKNDKPAPSPAAAAVVSPKAHESREAWDAALAARVGASEAQLVVLAGFMRIVGKAMLERFPNRIVNVHPALLPSFPGAHGAEEAIAKGVRIAGCTVHLVDAGVDTGPILAQAAVPVLPGDDAKTLHARIQVHEHTLLPAVIDAIARGGVVLGDRPIWKEVLWHTGESLVSPPISR